MKIGFTGTQRGMTNAQKVTLRSLLNQSGGEFHHGDCIGADAEAHHIAVGLGYEPVIHPPRIEVKRAFMKAARIEPPFEYLDRNKNIVRQTEILIATPGENDEQMFSGTWSTIRFARKRKAHKIVVILPDGVTQTIESP